MFVRLRHHRVVGGDHEHCEIDAGRAGHHVVNEPLMAGNVDNSELDARKRQVGETEVDRDSAPLLFRQSVGVDPRQATDEARLAMVDVTGRTKNQMTRFLHSRNVSRLGIVGR
jgi:hypothetical protein